MPGTDHNNLSGTIAIHPAAFVQSTDPGAVGAGKLWVDTSSGSGLSSAPYPLKKRNSGNSGWDYIGSTGSGVSSVALTMPSGFSVSGSPITSSGTLAVSAANETANTVWAGPASGSATTPAFRALVAADIPGTPYACIEDQKTQNTDGGTFTSGAWQTRALNTTVSDTASIAPLSSNHVTLTAGTYRVSASAPAYAVARHQCRLQNTTDSTTLLIGSSSYAAATNGEVVPRSDLAGAFVLSGTKTVELQHQCQTTKATNGFGLAANFTTEVYVILEIWKIA